MTERPPRRRFVLTLGTTGLAAGSLGLLVALARSVVPDVLYEAPRRFPVGRPEEFPPDSATLLADRRVFVFRDAEGFHAIDKTIALHFRDDDGHRLLTNGGRKPQQGRCPQGEEQRLDGDRSTALRPRRVRRGSTLLRPS